MPFIRIEIRESTSKKTPFRRVIICACDNCGEEVEKRYKTTTLEQYVSGELLAFCDRKCLHKSTRKNGVMRKKMQETCLDVYGADDPNRSQVVKDKIAKTCEEKYGHRSYLGSQAHIGVMEKILAEYGVSNISQVPEVRQKILCSMMNRYGTIHPTQSEEIKGKIRNNCQKKFGVRWPSLKPDLVKRTIERFSSPEFKIKRHNSLKRSGFYRRQTSSGEEKLFSLLAERFPLTQRHVNVEKWNIDFYIPEIDCFVNYNGVYWHGKNLSFDELLSSSTKQSKTILETKRRDGEREAWFKENAKRLVVIWEDDFHKHPALDTWFAGDSIPRKVKILGQ